MSIDKSFENSIENILNHPYLNRIYVSCINELLTVWTQIRTCFSFDKAVKLATIGRHDCRFNSVSNVFLFVSRLFIYLFIYLALPTRAGSPQQHMPITVGPFCLTHPVNFPCGRKPEYPEETHDFRQSVDFYSFHMRTGFESHWESSHWDLNLRPQRWKASALTGLATEAHYNILLLFKHKRDILIYTLET
jgi:hypothetical protein